MFIINCVLSWSFAHPSTYLVPSIYSDTMHNGDDLQQGLILHKLHGKNFIVNPQRKHELPYRVEVISDVVCPTDVPVSGIPYSLRPALLLFVCSSSGLGSAMLPMSCVIWNHDSP